MQHRETSKAMKYLKLMVDKGFSANAIIAALFIDLLLSNQVDEIFKSCFQSLSEGYLVSQDQGQILYFKPSLVIM